MRFSATLPLLTAALALASPSPKPATNAMARDATTTVNEMTAAIQFAAQADCDVFQCANVVASTACIAAGIASGMIEAVLACVASGSTGICPCAACIPGLNDFLANNGICT
ncbi:uncharacterized protein CC84DRAFT_1212862 [Paraphaeosphaeria sporulosa]|uniref:Fungal calcium binding protein domain-containing protein n=1 Tax=Paraphaeosphaeria sporulosa TaxID=1460663 RepID=A0A177CRM7_9PLEO|nr:uncharacterized protein CC84DRAFT_1212862 [Paraphaeosphaeria sporulosa]OAG09427.1 hypothetical protein CC84DRAFT_1212862 [Paraphaeosphaeria sporulosa]